MDVPIAASVLGTIGAVCWSIQVCPRPRSSSPLPFPSHTYTHIKQLIPQIIINCRRHNTIGLQRSMMLLWTCAGVPLVTVAYNIAGDFNIALQIQPQILTTLSLITWIQCYYYDEKWSAMKCCIFASPIAAMFEGIETGLVIGLKAAVNNDIHWPIIFMGVLSAALLSAGVLRHYWDIYIHRTFRGISFIFVGIDAAGDVFSFVSIFFQPRLDVLGMVIYATEFVLWCGVFACGGYFNFLPWVQQILSVWRQGRKAGEVIIPAQEVEIGRANGQSNDIDLRRVPLSISVFRTPSSIISSRIIIKNISR